MSDFPMSDFPASDRVRCTITDGVADVRLTRGDKLNALDRVMFDALIAAGEALHGSSSLRAVVLSGEGRAFCAGLDLLAFSLDPDQAARAVLGHLPGRYASIAQNAVTVWARLPVPVIAAIHGYALGGGLQLALGADLRIVAPDAQLSVLEIRLGLIPDMAATQILPGLVGVDVAKELTFTGRMVSGVEAVAMGLATRLSDSPHQDALMLAREIASKSPAAVRSAKALLDGARQLSWEEGLLAEQQAQRRLIGSADQVEALGAHLEQREPRFGG
jgi:enoyl-CoA hydratase/carnithine racemase